MLDLLPSHVSVIVCFLLLTYASWFDVRTGSIPNRLWLIASISGCILAFSKCIVYDPTRVVVTTVFSLLFAFLLSLALFKMKLFGGADAKALATLSIYVPTVIPFLPSPSPLLTPLSTTVNLVVFLILIFSINLARNLFSYFFGERGLRISNIPSLRRISLLCTFRKLPSRAHESREILHAFSDRSNAPFSLVIIGKVRGIYRQIPNEEVSSISPKCSIVEAWTPLRIPVVLLLTLSLLSSLLVGDLLVLVM